VLDPDVVARRRVAVRRPGDNPRRGRGGAGHAPPQPGPGTRRVAPSPDARPGRGAARAAVLALASASGDKISQIDVIAEPSNWRRSTGSTRLGST
jgi:hypothetical protein